MDKQKAASPQRERLSKALKNNLKRRKGLVKITDEDKGAAKPVSSSLSKVREFK